MIAALNVHRVDYVLIGGGALNVHGLIRATEYLDLFVRPVHSNIEALRAALRAVWADPEIEKISAEDLLGDYPAVRYGPPSGTLSLDLLTRLGDTTYDTVEAEVVEVDGVPIRVATPTCLFRIKRSTMRARDQADALALKEAFDLEPDVER